jgi:hypothetical protein
MWPDKSNSKRLTQVVRKVVLLGFLGICSTTIFGADSWFDTYGRLGWKEEMLRLSNFAVYLEGASEMTGYVAFNWRTKAEREVMKKRVERSVKYLINVRKVSPKRIVIVDGGKRENSRIVLQPVDSRLPPPNFS